MRQIVFTVLVTMSALSSAQVNELPIVKAQSGQDQGIIQEGTMAFLGIPYAKVERMSDGTRRF